MNKLSLYLTTFYSVLQLSYLFPANGAITEAMDAVSAARVHSDAILDYQKNLSRMSAERAHKTSAELRKEGVKLLRGAREEANGISEENYKFLKGTSAVAASGADIAHESGIFGEGGTHFTTRRFRY